MLDEAAARPKPDAEFLIGLAELYTSFGLEGRPQKETDQAQSAGVAESRSALKSRQSVAAAEAGGRFQPAGRFGQSRPVLPDC